MTRSAPPTLPPNFPLANSAASTALLSEPIPQPVGRAAPASSVWAVLFAGGIGSRFWPLSTSRQPKALLALVTGRPLLADSVGRLQPVVPPDRVLIVTSADIAGAIRRAVPEVPEANVLVEPRPLGTAAALAWGVSEVARRAGPEAMVIALHADLAVAFEGAYRHTLERATLVSEQEKALVVLGVRPTRAERAFGYVSVGSAVAADASLERGGAFHASRFTEKPSAHDAAALVAAHALWHSGIVMGSAGTFLRDIARFVHEVSPALGALARADTQTFWQRAEPVSLERGLLERTDRLLVMLADFGWDDVGTWASVRRARELDDHGNGALGPAHFVESTSNVVHSETGTVVLYGVSNLLVVTRDGITFVTTLERSQDLKPLLDALPGSMRIDPARRGGPSPAE